MSVSIAAQKAVNAWRNQTKDPRVSIGFSAAIGELRRAVEAGNYEIPVDNDTFKLLSDLVARTGVKTPGELIQKSLVIYGMMLDAKEKGETGHNSQWMSRL